MSLNGQWLARSGVPDMEAIEQELAQGARPQAIQFDTTRLGKWDSGLVSFILRCVELCRSLQVEFKIETLPAGIRGLVHLAQAAPDTEDATQVPSRLTPLARVGESAVRAEAGMAQALTFVGELVLAAARLFRGRAQFRWSDAALTMQECGPEALGIVALINFLIGLILAFVGATAIDPVSARPSTRPTSWPSPPSARWAAS